MPHGKPAGVPCVQLDPATLLCRIWNTPEYPAVCRAFRAQPDACGETRAEALVLLSVMEVATMPG